MRKGWKEGGGRNYLGRDECSGLEDFGCDALREQLCEVQSLEILAVAARWWWK